MTLTSGVDFESRFNQSYNRVFTTLLASRIAALPDGATVAEFGAGANPLVASEPRIASGALRYLRIDISEGELEKGEQVGEAVVADVSSPDFNVGSPVDLALSRMLAEHLPDGQTFLENVLRMLNPGGVYIQLSPVLFALPFIVNKLIPERSAGALLSFFAKRDPEMRGKFPADYSWCRAPSRRHVRKLEQLGFEVEAARGYFGHLYYKRLPPVLSVERRKAAWLARRPVPALAAYAIYVLRKPDAS